MNLQQTKGCMSLQPDCRVVVLLLRIRLCFVPILFALSVLCVPQAAQAAITFSNATLVAATDETDESDAHVYALTADASVQLTRRSNKVLPMACRYTSPCSLKSINRYVGGSINASLPL